MSKFKQWLRKIYVNYFMHSLLRRLFTKPTQFCKIYFHGWFNSNRINSFDASLESLHGNFIEIQKGTVIDSLSNIGSYTYVGQNVNITQATIGRYVSIANNVTIGPGEHDLSRCSTSSFFYEKPWEILTQSNCDIESDVWVGVDAIVLRGVRVGFGSVVAANAVVTTDVPEFAVVAGSPARIIRYRFSEQRRRDILASRWWEKDLDEATLIIKKLD